MRVQFGTLVHHHIGGKEITRFTRSVRSDYDGIRDTGELPDDGFHLAGFHPVTADLDLPVSPAEVFQGITTRLSVVRQQAHDVPCTVGALPFVFEEYRFGFLLQVHITASHSESADHQLACRARGHLMPVRIHDPGVNVGGRGADGDLILTSDLTADTGDSRFGRAVTVQDAGLQPGFPDSLIQRGRKCLRAEIDQPDSPQRLTGFVKSKGVGQERWGAAHFIYPFPRDQFRQRYGVVDLLLRCHDTCCAVAQRDMDLHHGEVK